MSVLHNTTEHTTGARGANMIQLTHCSDNLLLSLSSAPWISSSSARLSLLSSCCHGVPVAEQKFLAVRKPRQFQQTWGRERQGFFLQIPRDLTASILVSLITNISIFDPKMFRALLKLDTAFYSKTPWHQAAPQAHSLLAKKVYISYS